MFLTQTPLSFPGQPWGLCKALNRQLQMHLAHLITQTSDWKPGSVSTRKAGFELERLKKQFLGEDTLLM